MAQIKKKIFFDCPLRVVLTEEGITAFMSANKKFHRIQTAERGDVYGIKLTKFSFQAVKRMIEMGYTKKLEMPIYDSVSSISDIQDMSKLFIYNMFYRKFDHHIYSLMINSPIVDNWNMLETGIILNLDTVINDKAILNIAAKRNIDIESLKPKVLQPIKQSIIENLELKSDEKNLRLLLSEKYIDNIRPITWLCLALQGESDEYDSFEFLIHDVMDSYLEKASIAEFLSTMVLELISEREFKSLNNFCTKRYKNVILKEKLINDSELRNKMLEEMGDSDDRVTLGWEIEVTRNNDGKLMHKMDIKIFSSVSDYMEMNEHINEKLALDIEDKSLADFLMEESDLDDFERGGNPYYYIPFFVQMCKESDISFKVLAHQSSDRDTSIISLKLQF